MSKRDQGRIARAGRRSFGEFVDALQADGRYVFDRREVSVELGLAGLALKKAVARLKARRRLCVPRRGFYVVVPLEYRSAGAPPPSWFIDALMRHMGRPYYVGVLSAAAIHGAAHQQPQEFQVVTDRPVRSLRAGRARIRFVMKGSIDRSGATDVKTDTGTMRVAAPETTALDLLLYPHAAGGFGNIVTVLAELSERLNPRRLVAAAVADGELARAQRLGCLLDRVGAGDRVGRLAAWVARRKPRLILLRPGRPSTRAPVDDRWQVVVNERVEADL
ncbi:MAG: type IV toxin-antitoxin system AbiEi family antitoxin [Deltaproteobacteria bacterium]|nr:type IV toxin-antitoxin system AbiEi family antitoxin [Deltaproteobacteria bacterium]